MGPIAEGAVEYGPEGHAYIRGVNINRYVMKTNDDEQLPTVAIKLDLREFNTDDPVDTPVIVLTEEEFAVFLDALIRAGANSFGVGFLFHILALGVSDPGPGEPLPASAEPQTGQYL